VVIGDWRISGVQNQGKKSQKVDERGPKVEEKGPKVSERGPKVGSRRGDVGVRMAGALIGPPISPIFAEIGDGKRRHHLSPKKFAAST
jgi:hypothetical protein